MTEMDLCVARAGPFHLAVAASQLAGVAPCPAHLAWPPSPEGFMGLAPTGADQGIAVVDPLARWRLSELAIGDVQPVGAPVVERGRPSYLLVLAGGALALAVDAYALRPCAVQPAPAVLASRGVHALTPLEDGYAVVLDMARLADILYEPMAPPTGMTIQAKAVTIQTNS